MRNSDALLPNTTNKVKHLLSSIVFGSAFHLQVREKKVRERRDRFQHKSLTGHMVVTDVFLPGESFLTRFCEHGDSLNICSSV